MSFYKLEWWLYQLDILFAKHHGRKRFSGKRAAPLNEQSCFVTKRILDTYVYEILITNQDYNDN